MDCVNIENNLMDSLDFIYLYLCTVITIVIVIVGIDFEEII